MKKFMLSAVFSLSFCCQYCFGQVITTIAGTGVLGYAGDGSQATSAKLLYIGGVAVDPQGNLFISTEYFSSSPAVSVVRKVNSAGIISTFAGIDTIGFSGDGGPSTNARLFYPTAIAFDKKGNVYIAEMNGNKRVRKVDASGVITTFAGNGSSTISGDGGPATAAGLGTGVGLCSDTAGNIYIGAGNKIRKVDTTGVITTFAGTGSGVYSGDGGLATAAGFSTQGQIAMDRNGNMFVADNSRVRKINAAGIITTIAGNGIAGFSGDNGPATNAQLHSATGVYSDNCDNIYIADFWYSTVRVVNGAGIIRTFAGSVHGTGGIGTGGFGGDAGQATSAELNSPDYIYIDASNNIYVADDYNLRVRYIHLDSCVNSTEAPQITNQTETLRVWPNPSIGGTFVFNLSSSVNEEVKLIITNMMGEKVKELSAITNRDSEVKIEVPEGVYFISAVTGEGRTTKKIVVER